MLYNYLKTAFRNLVNYKVGSTINIVGLAIAFLTTITIYAWVQHELSYDTMHKDSNNIYRLEIGDKDGRNISIGSAIKTRLLDNIPEIKSSVRLFKGSVIGGKTKVAYKDNVFTNNEIVYADESFFNVFSFPLLYGNETGILNKPNSVVLTEKVAEKYFGNENPIGKSLVVSNSKLLEITGVLKNLPSNSHLHFDMLVSMKSHPWGDIDHIGFGRASVFYNYLSVNKDIIPEQIIKKIDEQLAGIKLSFDWNPNFVLQPIKDIHLYSNGWNEFEPNGSITLVYVFIFIGILVLVVASINYINMTTAYSLKRSKEIGIRKTIGAKRKQVIIGFLVESVIIVLVAFFLALMLNELVKPAIIQITGIEINIVDNINLISHVFIFAFLLALIIGFLPSLFLSRISPVSLIKSKLIEPRAKFDLKSILLTIQFCISIFLIFGTIIIYNQMHYFQNKKLGYDRDKVVLLYTGYSDLNNRMDFLKQALLKNPNISYTSALSQIPSNIITGEGVNLPNGERIEVTFISTDKDFFNTLGINVVEGKDRINNLIIDQNTNRETFKNQFVVNNAFLNKIGVTKEECINQQIVIRHGNMKPGSIIGVIDDFHYKSLHAPIGPLVLEFDPSRYQHLMIKLNTDNISGTMKFIEQEWVSIAGDIPFEYQFLDDAYNSLYKAEIKIGYLILTFSLISILVGSIGLFGLSIFFAERKVKEIGIRKVIGASLPNIFMLLTKSFTKWVLIANLIAWPIGYFVMNKWLENFAYKIDITIWPFLLSGLTVFIITTFTISWQAVKAAIANPVESLRNE